VLGSDLVSRGPNREDECSDSTDDSDDERREEDSRRHTVEHNRHGCGKRRDEQNRKPYVAPLRPPPSFLTVLGDELAGQFHRVLPSALRGIYGRPVGHVECLALVRHSRYTSRVYNCERICSSTPGDFTSKVEELEWERVVSWNVSRLQRSSWDPGEIEDTRMRIAISLASRRTPRDEDEPVLEWNLRYEKAIQQALTEVQPGTVLAAQRDYRPGCSKAPLDSF